MYGLTNLLASEAATIQKTRAELPGVAGTYPHIMEMLIAIPQLIEHGLPQEDLAEETSFFFAHYLQLHATTRCAYNCYESGYYLEAIILVRNLIEAFIQMRYLRNHIDKVDDHVTQTRRIQFKVMFDEFSPGFYNKYYGQLFSESAHGMANKLILRTIGDLSVDGGTLAIGNRYEEKYASLVTNNLIAVLSGYFNFVDVFLPRNSIRKDEAIYRQFQGLRNGLNNAMQVLEDSKTEPQEVFKHFRALFRRPE